MDISITTEDFLNNITLYDSAHHIVRRVVKDDYLTSLDVFGYLRGPIFCNRRGSGTIYINVKGKKSAVKWSDTKNYISTIKATTNTLFSSDLQNPLHATHEINYLDPFGRTEQTIQYGVTPALNSLVSERSMTGCIVIVVHGFRRFVSVRRIMFHHPISKSISLNCIMMSMLVKNLFMTVRP